MLNEFFNGGSGQDPVYVDDVFSTFLYDGTGSTQTITNGVDLSGEGGAVWIKERTAAGFDQSNQLIDSQRGIDKYLITSAVNSQITAATKITSFNSNGFTLGSNTGSNSSNAGSSYASWTFRKAPGFFDVVTYTGDGIGGREIPHSLGSKPGFFVVKSTSGTNDWISYHHELGYADVLRLNTIQRKSTQAGFFHKEPTADYFAVGQEGYDTNQIGQTYVCYLFAHDDQQFGTGGNESIIKCGSYTGTGAVGNSVNLGWEPQWVLVKKASGGNAGNYNWTIVDTMRGAPVQQVNSVCPYLSPNTSTDELLDYPISPSPTGFIVNSPDSLVNDNGATFIYIAIRRPHKPPTAGTDVFSPIATTAGTGTNLTTGFPVDWQLVKDNRNGNNGIYALSRLTGVNTTDTENSYPYLQTSSNGLEGSSNLTRYWDNTGYSIPTPFGGNSSIYWNFRRAPGFFDVVTWAGDGSSNRAITHNLGVTPELLITKRRTGNDSWWSQYTGIFGTTNGIRLDSNAATNTGASAFDGTSAATSSVFYVGSDSSINGSSDNYVAYLFATLPGISKVGTYPGTGSAINVDCGFTAGARFVMIKRVDDTGSWFVWDSARGINSSANDPYLRFNDGGAEIDTDYLNPLNAGFPVTIR